MKYLFIVTFIIFSILESKAQSDFREGYIINNNNDTINLLIDYNGLVSSHKKCICKTNSYDKTQIYTPEDIKAYKFIDSKYYESKPIVTNKGREKFFLEYLIDGIVDIYYYRDINGGHYFVDDESGNLHELKNEEKEIIKGDIKYQKQKKEYLGVLAYTFRESPAILKKIGTVNLSHKSLINIANEYHNEICSDEECIIYQKKPPKIKSSFGFTIGLSGQSIIPTGEFSDELYFMKNSQFGFEISPSIGFYYKVNIPFVNENLYFQYEGTYSRISLKTTTSYIEPVYEMNYIDDIALTQNSFNNLGILKYEFPKGKFRPTFQIGGFINYFFKSDYSRNLEVIYSWGDTYFTEQIHDNPFSKFDYGINIGAGLRSIYLKDKELFLDFRYKRGFGLLQSIQTNTFSINIGTQIGK